MKPVVVLQETEQDSGTACLATICKYYGKRIPIAYIRKISTASENDTSGHSIVSGAEELGFSCTNIASPDKIITHDRSLPIIVLTNKNNNDHYMVVFKIKKRYILIGDPSRGLVKTAVHDFKKIWTGVFFVLTPQEQFKTNKESKNIFGQFFYLLKPHKKIVIEVLTASIVLSFLGIITAFYFRFLIDNVLYSEAQLTLNVVSFGYFIVIIFQTLLNISRNQLMLHMSIKMEASLSFEYFEHVLHLPSNFFTTRKTGEILARINDVNTIRQILSSTGINIILDSLMLLIGGAFLYSTGKSLLLIAMIPVLLSALVIYFFIQPYQKKIKEKAIIDAKKQSGMVETLNGIETIKALSSEALAFERTEINMVDSMKKGLEIGTLTNIENAIQMALSQLGVLAVYWIGCVKIFNGTMSLGQLIAFSILSGYFLGPLGRLLTLQPTLQEAAVSAERLSEILQTPVEKDIYSGSLKPKTIKGKINIKNLMFSYDNTKTTLKNINLDINEGMNVAFVGSSGSGKTSLVKLLMKLYNFESGEILIDDLNIKDLDTKHYRKQIAYVPQEVLLFSGSIRENILWGNDFIEEEELYYAARASKANDFIEKMPERYNTIIGERGATLSGGERQRIALARILLRNPKILILDEATASLDSITEKTIMKTVQEITKDKTTIIVAHRLSTIVH